MSVTDILYVYILLTDVNVKVTVKHHLKNPSGTRKSSICWKSINTVIGTYSNYSRVRKYSLEHTKRLKILTHFENVRDPTHDNK